MGERQRIFTLKLRGFKIFVLCSSGRVRFGNGKASIIKYFFCELAFSQIRSYQLWHGDFTSDQSTPVTKLHPWPNFTGDQALPVTKLHRWLCRWPNFTGDQRSPVTKLHRWPNFTGDQTSPVTKFHRWPDFIFTTNALLIVTVVIVYFDAKIVIVSVSEAVILDYKDFDMTAILQFQDGHHENCEMHY